MLIHGLDFVQTCCACPEQYDVYRQGHRVGYVRLRFGILAAYVPTFSLVPERLVYKHSFYDDDEWLGEFHNEAERQRYLEEIAGAIYSRLKKAGCYQMIDHYVEFRHGNDTVLVQYKTWDHNVSPLEVLQAFEKDGVERCHESGEYLGDRVQYVLNHIDGIVDYEIITPIVCNVEDK
jgi:hypothetical protein